MKHLNENNIILIHNDKTKKYELLIFMHDALQIS